MKKLKTVIQLLLLSVALPLIHGQLIEDMYCGQNTCYDILGVTRESPKPEIVKVYRKLAKEHDPDFLKNKGARARAIKKAMAKLQEIETAYETLKDSDAREEYDYYLDYPEKYFYNYYRYYRRKLNVGTVDLRYVIVGTIIGISVAQYITWMALYNTAINYILHAPKYRTMAIEEAQARGLLLDKSSQRKKSPKKKRQKKEDKKEEVKVEDEDAILRKIVEEKADIRGGYEKPKVADVLIVQIFFLPAYHAYIWTKFYMNQMKLYLAQVKFHLRWIYKYRIKKEQYTKEDMIYLMKKNVEISAMSGGWGFVPWGFQRNPHVEEESDS